jgi:hypothetical protein
MARRKSSPRGKRVSAELAEVLNRIAGDLPARRRAEARQLLAGT